MWNTSPLPRVGAPTRPLVCKHCGRALRLVRSCRSVRLHCLDCDQRFELSDYADQADAMEEFLASVPCDRI